MIFKFKFAEMLYSGFVLAMPRTGKVTTVCNGKRKVWTDYEEAKAYFLELMMSMNGEEH